MRNTVYINTRSCSC